MNLKLLIPRNKLFIAFILILLICLIVIFISHSIKDRQLKMEKELLMEKNTLIQIQKINRLGISADNEGAYYLLSSTDDEKKRHLFTYKKTVEELQKELDSFRTTLTRPEHISSVSKFDESWKKYLQDNERAFQLEKEEPDKAKALYIEITYNEVKQNLTSMREKQRKLIEEKQHDIDKKNLIMDQISTGITVTFILITVVLAWILSRKIQLEYHMKTQKQFYQNMSHELKTPLMSIQGYAQAIHDGTIQGEKVDHSLRVIIYESDRLKRLVTEMILLSMLENEKNSFELQIVPVEFLIEESIFRIHPLLKDKGVHVELQSTYLNDSKSPLVKVDSEKCLQALLNILSNALRYAVHTIVVSISEEEQQVLIDIKDDGEGIPEEALTHLFERFFKGKNGENGLGLAIARAIIDQCGGTIKAWNHQDGGAVFRIMFPTALV